MKPDLRRDPPRGPDPGSDPALVDAIRAEIEQTGPITFARFMERALYEPDLGYYRRPGGGPGTAGDFLTAPETHPIFGRAVGRQLDEMWARLERPHPFVVREHGAGRGALAAAVLDGLAADRSALLEAIRYEPIEIGEASLDAFARRLASAGHAARWTTPANGRFTGAVVANEVLDALPVHRVEQRDGELRELLVDWVNGRFVHVAADPSTPALAARLEEEGVRLVEGQRAEIALGVGDWVSGAVAPLERGLVLLVDYGHPAAELYGPRRLRGTLAAYVGHRVHDDPFVNVGRQDLTAHVDLTAVERAATASGLDHLGTTTQAEFLAGLGIEDVLRSAQADPTTTLESYAELRSGLMRLLDPAVTGRFAVLLFGRGIAPEPPLRGLSYRIPPRPRNA